MDKHIAILIVEDDELMRQILKGMMNQMGFQDVDDAGDGKSALSKMEQKKYGLIISDWNMSPMSGLMFLRRIRSSGNAVPFIMVTGNVQKAQEEEARKAGATEFISKNVDLGALKTRIGKVLEEVS